MKEDRLNGLTLMMVHRTISVPVMMVHRTISVPVENIIDISVPVENIIDTFAARHPRRMRLELILDDK